MKAVEKKGYVEEARKLYDEIKVSWFCNNPNDVPQIRIINRLIAIFTLFSSNDGQELRILFKEFQKWARAGKRQDHIENCAADMVQFIGQKIEEMDIYEITEEKNQGIQRILDELKNERLWVRTSAEGKDLHIIIGERGSKAGEHVHLIQDASTGLIRIDRSDQPPEELIQRVVSITTKSGDVVSHSQKGITTTLEFSGNKSEEGIFDNLDMNLVVTTAEHLRILREVDEKFKTTSQSLASKGAPIEIVSLKTKPVFDRKRGVEMSRWSKSETIYKLKREQIEDLYDKGSKERRTALNKLDNIFGKE